MSSMSKARLRKGVNENSKDELGSKSKIEPSVVQDDQEDKETLAYKVLSAEHTKELMGLKIVEMQDKIREIFNLNDFAIDLTQASILDYYTSAIYWAIQQKFSAQQVSGFFTVVHNLLESVREKQLSFIESTMEFNKLLAGIGVDDVRCVGLDFFNLDHAKQIYEYVHSTFFKHYRLFLYMFTHSQSEEIIGTDLEIEVSKSSDMPFPPPLDEGVSQEMFQEYLATPPPTPTPEPKDTDWNSLSPTDKNMKPSSSTRRHKRPSPKGASPQLKSSAGKSRASTSVKALATKKKGPVPKDEEHDGTKELEDQVAAGDLFAQLTAEDVKQVIESVTKEMLGSLQNDVANKLKDKEQQIVQRINKIHKVDE